MHIPPYNNKNEPIININNNKVQQQNIMELKCGKKLDTKT